MNKITRGYIMSINAEKLHIFYDYKEDMHEKRIIKII